jgi:6-pyruvoyltetrahydropterin/6-carboxytetrahydropterin synthase
VTFEVGTSASLRAFHRMPDVPGPESELHDHEYRLDVVVTRRELDERGMVCDLDVLNAALARVVQRLDGADLETIRPADADAVTVEVFARWVHGELAGDVLAGGGEIVSVRVWESPEAFGGYRAPVE